MKKILLSVCCLFIIHIAAFTQPVEGNYWVSGAVSFYTSTSKTVSGSTTTTGPSTTQFALMPAAGLFLSSELLLGSSLGFSNSIQKSHQLDGETRLSNPLVTLSPFVRYYVNPGQSFMMYGEAFVSAGFGAVKWKYTMGNQSVTSRSSLTELGMGGRVGLAYYLSEMLALEMRLGLINLNFTSITDEDDVQLRNTSLGLNLTPASVSVGVSFLF
jgi:hypothetical protein